MIFAVAIAAFLAGGALSTAFFYIALSKARERAVSAETQLRTEQQTREIIEQQFRLAAENILDQTRTKGAEKIQAERTAVESAVQAIEKRLTETDAIIRAYEKGGAEFQGTLLKTLEQVSTAAQNVEKQALSIKQSMVSGTSVRGSFGQMVLETILEENGLQKGIHYAAQVSKDGSIPDFVIYLPGENRLAIDAKEVSAEFLLAQDCESEDARKAHYMQLAKNIKTNFVNLSSRAYQDNIEGSLPFIVMFVSNEAAMRAALSADPTLFEEARRRKIYLASPMTIVPMIQLVRLSIQQQTLAENAEELGRVVEDLGRRLNTFIGHLQKIGKAIGSSVESWDDAVGSWDRMVTPQLERVRELGGKFQKSPELPTIGKTPRLIEKASAER